MSQTEVAVLSRYISLAALLTTTTLATIAQAYSDDGSMATLRSVRQIMPQTPRHWVGDGFHVHPVFANKAFTEEMSPFLMFDYAPPTIFPPNSGPPKGVGQHPHRGFETVTIAFDGEVEHKDSNGGHDIIKKGDVQWMTAARGIVHQEFHSKGFSERGGTFEMCQLWVNLPKKFKMTKPSYQAILDGAIPVADLTETKDGQCSDEKVGNVRVIAGSFGDTKGPATTRSPVELWDVTIDRKATVDLPFPPDYNCIVFVRRGVIDVLGNDGKSREVEPQGVALMKTDGGDRVRIIAKQKNTSLLVMGGRPLNEPIAARGPFVMNTMEEIYQANRDYHMGKF